VSTEAKIQELTAELKQHNYDYYVLANSAISDRDFDMKLKELEKLEHAFPQYADPNSPTQQVGGDITKKFQYSTTQQQNDSAWAIRITKKNC